MKYLIHILFPICLLGLDLSNIENLSTWETLQDGNIKIGWTTYESFPICRSETILNHSIDRVANQVQNLDDYPKIFDRVTSTKRLEDDIVQIVLDMPFPFDGRDYIIKYGIESSERKWVFSFHSVQHPMGNLDEGHVRLPNAAGVWILTKIDENKTKVIYAWNGELLGNFPDFGLMRAWRTQGTEVLTWLEESLMND